MTYRQAASFVNWLWLAFLTVYGLLESEGDLSLRITHPPRDNILDLVGLEIMLVFSIMSLRLTYINDSEKSHFPISPNAAYVDRLRGTLNGIKEEEEEANAN